MVFETENLSSRTSSAGATVDSGLVCQPGPTPEKELGLDDEDVTDEDLH